MKVKRFTIDGKAPEGIEDDGRLYLGTVIQWFESFDEAKRMREIINAAYCR